MQKVKGIYAPAIAINQRYTKLLDASMNETVISRYIVKDEMYFSQVMEILIAIS
jgi:hypothetical protein